MARPTAIRADAGPVLDCSILIASFGDRIWERRARRAAASAVSQGAVEVLSAHEPEGSLASCRNALAQRARSEWLLWLDADDTLAPGYLAAMSAALARRPAGEYLLTPAVRYGDRGRARMWPRVPLQRGNWLVIGTLVRRELALAVGGFRDWPLYEDWCLWQRCEIAGARIVPVPGAVYLAGTRPGSRNRSLPRHERARVHAEIVAANYPGTTDGPRRGRPVGRRVGARG